MFHGYIKELNGHVQEQTVRLPEGMFDDVQPKYFDISSISKSKCDLFNTFQNQLSNHKLIGALEHVLVFP